MKTLKILCVALFTFSLLVLPSNAAKTAKPTTPAEETITEFKDDVITTSSGKTYTVDNNTSFTLNGNKTTDSAVKAGLVIDAKMEGEKLVSVDLKSPAPKPKEETKKDSKNKNKNKKK
jgi:hypothetical protein